MGYNLYSIIDLGNGVSRNVFRRKMLILRLMLTRDGYRRGKYLRRIKLFHKQGEHCFFAPHNYGTEPYLLSFGDNVHVATGVTFVTHDVTAKMFQYMDPGTRYTSRIGTIDVGNNVFIGAGVTILYDVKIADNIIIGAGALVNGDLTESGVYAGIPARRVGDFEEYMAKSRSYSQQVPWTDKEVFPDRRRKQKAYIFGSRS